MRKTFKLFSFLASFAFAGSLAPVMAQTAAATPAATAAATPAPPTVAVGGYMDAYYTYDFTNSSKEVGGSGTGYFYNSADDAFTLGLAEAKLTATQGPASAHIVLAYGQEGSLNLVGTGFDVLQAYASYATGQWTFNGGRFVTWLGDEVVEANSNWNYSHSLLFAFIPVWHTGVSVNFAPSSTFGITGYVVDGNNTTTSSPDGKDFGLQLAITPNSMWTITLNGLFGPAAGNSTGYNNFGNMTDEGIFVFKPDSMWSFALDAEYGMTSFPSPVPTGAPSSTSFWGVALYGRDQITSDYAVALRLEDVSDSGELGFGQYINGSWVSGSLMEGTLTVEHNLSANMLVRLEGRYDTNSLPTGSGTTTAAAPLYALGTSTSEFTLTLGTMLSF
jgi:hypothetical protein